MKGCLKLSSRSSSPGPECPHARKCVAFGAEGSEEVYVADEWDRTPAEPARKLSYQDLLELKEIQRSLPCANQLPDPHTGKPGSHYLSGVRIGLLPLLPENNSADNTPLSSSTASPITSPTSSVPGSPSLYWGPSRDTVIAPQPRGPVHPWHASHPNQVPPGKSHRQQPRFAFLPLLDTPPTSASSSPYPSNPPTRTPSPDHLSDTDQSQDPPTPSLTNASVDSSPYSRASSTSPEPPFFQLPPPRRRDDYQGKPSFGPDDNCYPSYPNTRSTGAYRDAFSSMLPSALSSMRLHTTGNPHIHSPSPHPIYGNSYGHTHGVGGDNTMSSPPKPARRRNFIVVNGVEIECDGDGDDDAKDEEERMSTPPPMLPAPTPSNVDPKVKAPRVLEAADEEGGISPPRTPSPQQYGWRTSTPQLTPKSSPRPSMYTSGGPAKSLGSPTRFKRGPGVALS